MHNIEPAAKRIRCAIEKARISGLLIAQELRLLYVSFFVPLVSGHRPGLVANLLFFKTLSCHCPCMFGGAGGS